MNPLPNSHKESIRAADFGLLWAIPVAGAVVAFLMTGCGTVTGTKVSMDAQAISRIKDLKIQVIVEKDFSVSLAREGYDDAGYLAAGVVGGWVQNAVQAAQDSAQTKRLRPEIGDFSLQSYVETNLIIQLKDTRRFDSVVSGLSTDISSSAGILLVMINQWGLVATSLGRQPQTVQVAFQVTSKLTDLRSRNPLWVRRDFVTSGKPHTVDEFASTKNLLRHEAEEAMAQFCGRIANEIRYAK